jgi:hypothetical protein
MSTTLINITKRWVELLKVAGKHKYDKFGRAAEDAMRFYSDDHAFMFDESYSAGSRGLRVKFQGDSGVGFKATANLVSNMMEIFLPVLYHRNPNRVVNARRPNLPKALLAKYQYAKMLEQVSAYAQQSGMDPQMMAQMIPPPSIDQQDSPKEMEDEIRARLIEWVLNYSPGEVNLREGARAAVCEALIKGMGCLWCELFGEGNSKVSGLGFTSIDHILIDPDAENLNDAKWIARRRERPVHEVEDEFGYKRGDLKAQKFSQSSDADASNREDLFVAKHKSTDTIVYYEIYSRMGVGHRVKASLQNQDVEKENEALDKFGSNVFLAVSPDHEYPLNLPESVVNNPEADVTDEVIRRMEWAAPFHQNTSNPWPCVLLGFHPVPRSPWAMAHITPAMGYQKCINWILSFIMTRIRITSRQFIVVPRNLEEEIKNRILHGGDLELLEIENSHPGTVNQLADFLKMPEVNGELWNLLGVLKREFEDATGVTELNMSGRTNFQMRSAAEATVRREMLSVRPEDMANIVDDWMSAGAKLEAIMDRYLLAAEDVAPVFGEPVPQMIDMGGGMMVPGAMGPYTQLWMELVSTDDIDKITSEMEYRVESGSARKPNRDQQVQDMEKWTQILLPAYIGLWQQTGDPTAMNNFISMAGEASTMKGWNNMLAPDLRQQGPPPNGQEPVQEGPGQRMQPGPGGDAGMPPSAG